MNRKYMVLFIAIFTLGMFTVGGTYAYWTWASGTNKNVVFNTVSGVENFVVYDAGLSHFVGDFQPAANYCGGISNTISFKKTSNEVNLSATINMDVNAIEANMKASSDVYWVVQSGESSSCTGVLNDVLAYGTFNGKNNGDVIELLSDIVVTTTEQKFTIWIWINEDGTGLNKLSGETIDTNIWTRFDMVDNSGECLIYFDDEKGNILSQSISEGEMFTFPDNNKWFYRYDNEKDMYFDLHYGGDSLFVECGTTWYSSNSAPPV